MGTTTALLLLLMTSLALLVAGQDPKPSPYPFDCRRSSVGCQNSGLCSNEEGSCTCDAAGEFEGYNCNLTAASKTACAAENQCENNGECLSGDACFCDADTYGAKCENPRVKMWCTDSQMFININPHTSAFVGKIYLRKGDNREGREDTFCQLKIVDVAVDTTNLATYTFVKTVNGEVPTLAGFYFVQSHENAEGAADTCIQNATKIIDEPTGRVDYVQEVIIEYSSVVVSSVDQRVIFNCSVLPQVTDDPYTSENAMAVDLFDDDYVPVNVTDTIVPVLFEIRDPDTDVVITSNVNLGDPLDLTFTLQISEGAEVTETTIVDFKVTGCIGTNAQPTQPPPNITFLTEDCPASGSEMLYRAQVTKDVADTQKKTVIPLRAFRFVGSYDSVAFTCNLKLCSKSMVDANPDACAKTACSGDEAGEGGAGEGGAGEGGAVDGGDGGAVDGGDGGAVDGGDGGAVDGGAGDGGTVDGGAEAGAEGAVRRRKREAPPTEAQVNRTVTVISRYHSSHQTGNNNNNDDDDNNDNNTNNEGETAKSTEDCMQQSEVVVLIVIFAVIFVVLLVGLVTTVISLLRSRQKVVGVPSSGASMAAESHSHYSLPRLSLNTTM